MATKEETTKATDDDTTTNDSNSSITINLTLTSSPSSPRTPIIVTDKTSSTEMLNEVSTKTNIPRTQVKLIYRGRMIKDNDENCVVDEFKLQNDCVVHCMGKPTTAAVATAAAAAATTNGTSTAATATAATAAASSTISGSIGSGTTPGASVTMTTTTPNAASATASFGSAASAPTTPTDPLQVAINKLKSSNNSADTYLTAITTLEKIVSNIISKPMEEKYRSMKKNNAAFQKRLGGLEGGHDAMLAVGFTIVQTEDGEDGEEKYVMTPSPEAWPKLVANKDLISKAVNDAKQRTTGGTAAPPLSAVGAGAMPGLGGGMGGFGGAPGGMGMGGGMGGMGMGGGRGPMPPGMDAMMNNLMSDPQQLQAMLSNPMVRQMMQNDPRFRNNPQLQQQMDALTSNPQAMEQLSQVMSNPMLRQQMQTLSQNPQAMEQMQQMMSNPMMQQQMETMAQNPQAMQQMQSMMGMGMGGMGGQQQQQQPTANVNDTEMTEEEMIAEAIRRSMADPSDQQGNNNGSGDGNSGDSGGNGGNSSGDGNNSGNNGDASSS